MSDHHRFELIGASYELQIEIAASTQRVWKALTGQLSAWWLPDFHILGPHSIVALEPRAGGRLFEQNGDRELLWYTVLSIAPAESLSLVGYCTPEFGGPLTTMLERPTDITGGCHATLVHRRPLRPSHRRTSRLPAHRLDTTPHRRPQGVRGSK